MAVPALNTRDVSSIFNFQFCIFFCKNTLKGTPPEHTQMMGESQIIYFIFTTHQYISYQSGKKWVQQVLQNMTFFKFSEKSFPFSAKFLPNITFNKFYQNLQKFTKVHNFFTKFYQHFNKLVIYAVLSQFQTLVI